MQNPNEVEQMIRSALDSVGGEALAGSGFEMEIPERGFDSDESAFEGGR